MNDDGKGFKFFEVRPPLLETGKSVSRAISGQLLGCSVQVLAEGGENNLHNHPGNEAIWFVLQGEATFYTTGDEVVARVGKHQGLYIAAGSPYWFESTSPENLVVLRLGAQVNETKGRVDLSERQYALSSESAGAGRKEREVRTAEGSVFGS